MVCHDLRCHVMLCYVMSCDVGIYVMQCYVGMLGDVGMVWYVMFMLCCVYVMSC